MEVLQIFNRRTGIWSHRIILTAGYTESFVLDKSTDTAEVKWWEFTDSEIEPDYQDDDWVLMMHVEEKNDPVIFNADGTTKNATQYIIKSISKDYDEGNGLWKMSCALEEPIERFKRIVGETLSFTNQTSKVYKYLDGGTEITTTYYKEPYNYYTALRRWLMVTPANCDSYDKYLEVGDNTNNAALILSAAVANPDALLMEISFEDGTKLSAYSPVNTPRWEFRHTNGGTIIFEKTLYSGEIYEYKANAGEITGLSGYTDALKYICKIIAKPANNKSWYNRIKILDEQWLRSIPFADDTWNEMDLYRILFDKYDPLGKTPVIYFDLNTNTTLPNNMARDEYILKFERQDGFDKPVIDFDELIRRKPYERLLSYEVSKDNSTNITGLVCNAENLSSPTVVHYPAQGLFMPPEVDNNDRVLTGYNSQGDNWVLKLPHPIKRITKLLQKEIRAFQEYGGIYNLGIVETEISTVYEKQQYLALEPGSTTLDSSYSCCWYEEGSNLLHIRRYKYIQPFNGTIDSEKCYVFYVEYEPLPSARLIIGDEEKTQQINQTSSQVDAESFGRFADGYLKGSNKADITIGKLYAGDYEDFSDLIGSRVKRGDKTYMITQVAYRNIGMDGYNVFMQLNENHMRKNASYRAPQEIRANTAIATSNLKNRLTAIKQVVKVGFTAAAVADNDSYQFLTDKKILLSALCPNQIDSKYYPQVALFKGKSTLYKDANLTNPTMFEVTRLATVAKTIGKNQINIITTFIDNAEAGKSKKIIKAQSAGDYTFSRVQGQVPVLYADPFGEISVVEIALSSVGGDPFPNQPYHRVNASIFNTAFDTYQAMAQLPDTTEQFISLIQNNKSIHIIGLNEFKDMLEKCSINAVIEHIGEHCITCQNLITLSRLLNQTDAHTLKVWIKNSGINEYDTFTDGAAVNVSSAATAAGYIQLNLASVVTGATGKTLIISTNTNKPLIIYNDIDSDTATLLADSKLRVYFN